MDDLYFMDEALSLAREAAAEARRLGIRLVISDHHEVPEVLPEAIIS